jgi:uncharacterized protein YhbP (UPF0306 family)
MDIEKIIREYVDKTLHMSLATVSDNKPWVCEVHFTYDDKLNLYYRSLKSRRHSQEIAKNPNVAGNIVKQHELNEYPHAIYFEGTAEIMEDYDEIDKIFPYFVKRLNPAEDAIEDSKKEDGHKFYKITVVNWYAFGKFDQPSGGKFKLEWNGGKK